MKVLIALALVLFGPLVFADHFAPGSVDLMALKAGALGAQPELTMSSPKARVFINASLDNLRFVVSNNPENVNEGTTYELEFQAPESTKFSVNSYDHVPAIGFTNPLYAAMDVPGECQNPSGSFEILELQYGQVAPSEDDIDDNLTQVSKLAVNFVKTCNGVPFLAGALRYNSDLPVLKPIVIAPAPALELSKFKTTISMTSDTDDYVGGGQPEVLSSDAGLMKVEVVNQTLQISYNDGNSWGFSFAPNGGLKVGKFTQATRFLDYDQDPGNYLSIDSPGHGCNDLTGEFEIKNLVLVGNEVRSLQLDFTQHCEGAAAALRGEILIQPR